MPQDTGGLSGSREPGLASRPGPAGFDPGRVAARLGKRQREVVLCLTEVWTEALCHRAAKRLWWGEHNIVDHKHRTDNCWRLNSKGLAVKAAIAMEARQGGDGETRRHPKDDSAGPKDIAHD